MNVSVATAAVATTAEAEFHEGIASDAIVDPDETEEDVEEVRAKLSELGLWLDEDEQDFLAFQDDNTEKYTFVYLKCMYPLLVLERQ